MQSFSKKPLVGLLVVVALIVAITSWRLRVADTNRHTVSAPDHVVGIAAQPSTPGSPATISRTPLPGPMPTEAEIMLRREASKREAQQVVEAGKSKLVGQYQSEKVDAQWASAKEQRLQSLSTTAEMTSLNAIPTDMQVDCRSSVCRITATFRSRVAAEDWFTLYALNVGAEMPNASFESHVNPDGTVGVQVHGLARK
jgi:hypothetical protein